MISSYLDNLLIFHPIFNKFATKCMVYRDLASQMQDSLPILLLPLNHNGKMYCTYVHKKFTILN